MTEADWPILLAWNNDPEVLYFSEGDDVTSRTLDEVQSMYRHILQTAIVFMVEVQGAPVGECWLQQMNLARILEKYRGVDCRRIDLMLGEKELWRQGLGTEIIQPLSRFAFEVQDAGPVFGCDVADHHPRSRRGFEKVGYTLEAQVEPPRGMKAQYGYDLVLTRAAYTAAETQAAR